MNTPPIPPPSGFSNPSSSQARASVQAPATAMMIYAGVAVLFALLSIALNLFGMGSGAMFEGMEGMEGFGDSDMIATMFSGTMGIVMNVVSICLAGVVFFGAKNMKELRGWGLALAAAVIAIIPCFNGCCIVGIPVGIWALIVLLKADVKQAFT